MGVGFSHGGAGWSYQGFHEFRYRLAKKIGVSLNKMEGFDLNYKGKPWSEVNDPIKPLLNHSDYDGHLLPQECKEIAPRLRELVSDWPDDYDKANALRLAAGMDEAASANICLEFC